MSEERRKRQQERNPRPVEIDPQVQKKRLIWGGVVLVIALAYAGWWYYSNHRYDDFAKCLSSKQVKMYGAYWCPHCQDQKEKFKKSFQYVNYVECAIKGSRELTAACKDAGVQHFPSWQFGNNPLVEGVFPLEELSDKTGCNLP
jgi:glutaredoxin